MARGDIRGDSARARTEAGGMSTGSSNRHPAAVAIDKWLESKEGKNALYGTTSGMYLRNRLMHAFQAGWFAAEKHAQEQCSYPPQSEAKS